MHAGQPALPWRGTAAAAGGGQPATAPRPPRSAAFAEGCRRVVGEVPLIANLGIFSESANCRSCAAPLGEHFNTSCIHHSQNLSYIYDIEFFIRAEAAAFSVLSA